MLVGGKVNDLEFMVVVHGQQATGIAWTSRERNE